VALWSTRVLAFQVPVCGVPKSFLDSNKECQTHAAARRPACFDPDAPPIREVVTQENSAMNLHEARNGENHSSRVGDEGEIAALDGNSIVHGVVPAIFFRVRRRSTLSKSAGAVAAIDGRNTMITARARRKAMSVIIASDVVVAALHGKRL